MEDLLSIVVLLFGRFLISFLVPQLLHKYLPDPEKMANLLVIPQYFDMEIYTTSRQEKALDSLLKLLHEVVDKHSDKDVLETTAITLEKLCDDQQHIYNR